MDLIHFIIFACIVYIAIVLGRMSMKNDMRRRFASIEEGIELPNVTAVINYILKLAIYRRNWSRTITLPTIR